MHVTSSISPRYFERELGVEFTPYELRRKEEIKKAKITRSKEITGFVRWLPPQNTFVIMPTLTTSEPNIVCLIPHGSKITIPPDRSYISAKGKWDYYPNGTSSPLSVFTIDNYEITKPDIAQVKPDISYKEFRGTLFEGLYDVDETLQDFIAYSLVSSPTAMGRVGGLSLSLYNEYEKDKKSGLLEKYLAAFLPKEVINSSPYIQPIDGISLKVTLDPYRWSYKSFDADSSLSQDTIELLDRPASRVTEEVTISMFSKNKKPKSLRDPAAALTDVPIVVTRDIEKRRGIFDASPAIFRFMVATHLAQVTLPQILYQNSIDYIRQELTKMTEEYPLLRTELGRGRILDLDIHGKPLSLLHVGLSDGRSNSKAEITFDIIERIMSLFKENADNTMVTWEELYPDAGKYNLAGIAPEERKIVSYLVRNGPSTQAQVLQGCKNEMSETVFLRMWKSLYNGGVIYEKGNGIFDLVPHYTGI